jgi:hypothetical protein
MAAWFFVLVFEEKLGHAVVEPVGIWWPTRRPRQLSQWTASEDRLTSASTTATLEDIAQDGVGGDLARVALNTGPLRG